MRTALLNLEYFDLFDARGGKTVRGGDQEWYGSWWRRMSGCGPTTATNLILYITNARAAGEAPAGRRAAADGTGPGESIHDKRDFLRLMDIIWKHVTPGRGGINSTLKLRRGIGAYSGSKGLNLRSEALDIADERGDRPPLEHVTEFIRVGLERNLPVAFLNLDNGLEYQLDKWHWVTVTGVDYDEEGGVTELEILDNCNTIRVNLGRWLGSAARGGGFVRFLTTLDVGGQL